MFDLKEFNPTLLRSISNVKRGLGEGRVAFYIGTGLDKALLEATDEAIFSWSGLLLKLYKVFYKIKIEKEEDKKIFLEEYCHFWSSEIASLFPCFFGRDAFLGELGQLYDSKNVRKGSPEYEKALCALLVQSNMIVTTNYTHTVENILRRFIGNERLNKEVLVIDREDLPSLSRIECEPNPERIFVLHIHGRVGNSSHPVLDSWGYNRAENDGHYLDFLKRMFTERIVISIGASWNDIPFKSAAVFAQRARSYVGTDHLLFSGKNKKDSNRCHSILERDWCNSMRFCYGVNPVFLEHGNYHELYSALLKKESQPNIIHNKLRDIADYLDEAGDFESPMQHALFTCNSHNNYTVTLKDMRMNILSLYCRLMKCNVKTVDEWKKVARIERHFRHHLYLYHFNDRGKEKRINLWIRLYNRLSRGWWDELSARLQFDFATGLAEVCGNTNPWNGEFKFKDDTFKERVQLAAAIWAPEENTEVDNRLKLADELILLGWESLAAKVLSDVLYSSAAKLRKNPTKVGINSLLNLADRTASVSRVAGCTRRLVKADVIAAIWSEPRTGRLRLLSRIQNPRQHNFLEPILIQGIAFGLFICWFLARKTNNSGNIREAFKRILSDAGLGWDQTEGDWRYWLNVSPKDVPDNLAKIILGDS